MQLTYTGQLSNTNYVTSLYSPLQNLTEEHCLSFEYIRKTGIFSVSIQGGFNPNEWFPLMLCFNYFAHNLVVSAT